MFVCAPIRRPRGMAANPEGRKLYVADSGNNAIRVVTLVAQSSSDAVGNVRTLTGWPSAPGRAVQDDPMRSKLKAHGT